MVEKPTREAPNSSTTPEPNAPIETSTWLAIKSKVKLPEKVAELRRKLYQKAKQEPQFRFYALYDRIYRRDVLTAAWWIVLAKDRSPGIDGVTCRDILDAPGGSKIVARNMTDAAFNFLNTQVSKDFDETINVELPRAEQVKVASWSMAQIAPTLKDHCTFDKEAVAFIRLR